MLFRLSCEFCNHNIGHDYRCPKYDSSECTHMCIICGEGIQIGEEYIVNSINEYAHFDCVDYPRDLVKFLGYKIDYMEE